MNEPTIIELLNQIELMKQALLFYGNEDNYKMGQHDGGGSFPTMIDKDGGHQARFVLEQIQKTSEYIEKITRAINDGVDINKLDGINNELVNKMMEVNKIINKYEDKKNIYKKDT